ncbi:hypothetical protein PVAND_014879 [Polypedilum vanderplanki]|uniref:DH domain-containing protein n=1 Tax=Polypedilum vanderplanki TaxID=319348 RepID=A0A9J6BB12_POLVA|nr:hypothetical protein PVAND_014879 [Polypedilum vanderplanki]
MNFLPKLLECNDVEQIAELFTSYVTKDHFYGYIIYAINRKRSELSCNLHVQYWKQIQNDCGDRLGINSFLLQPIQRLPRYQLLLNEIIKDLSKDLENTNKLLPHVVLLKKNIQRLLDTVNESMSINDIRNCFEKAKANSKLFAKKRGCKEVEFHSDLNTVVLLENCNYRNVDGFCAAEKKRNAFNSIRRTSSVKIRSIPDSVRSSILSNLSNQSNISIGSSFRSSTSSGKAAAQQSQGHQCGIFEMQLVILLFITKKSLNFKRNFVIYKEFLKYK